MFEKAECRTCEVKRHTDARTWAHRHARETGHAVEMSFGYDVRAEDWLDRASPERRAELDEVRENPETARGLAEQLPLDFKGKKPN